MSGAPTVPYLSTPKMRQMRDGDGVEVQRRGARSQGMEHGRLTAESAAPLRPILGDHSRSVHPKLRSMRGEECRGGRTGRGASRAPRGRGGRRCLCISKDPARGQPPLWTAPPHSERKTAQAAIPCPWWGGLIAVRLSSPPRRTPRAAGNSPPLRTPRTTQATWRNWSQATPPVGFEQVRRSQLPAHQPSTGTACARRDRRSPKTSDRPPQRCRGRAGRS
jgi:hypothetical protein